MWWLEAIGGVLRIVGEYLVARAILAIGVGAATYLGVGTTLTWVKSQAVAQFSGLPADVLGMLAYMKVGESLNVVFSALVVRLTLAGLSEGGAISRWVKK